MSQPRGQSKIRFNRRLFPRNEIHRVIGAHASPLRALRNGPGYPAVDAQASYHGPRTGERMGVNSNGKEYAVY